MAALLLLALTTTSAAAQERQDPTCQFLPPGYNDRTPKAIQGSGLLGACGATYHDFEIQLNINLGPDRDLARAVVQQGAPNLYPTGATIRAVSGLGEVAKEALVGSDTDPHWYMLHFAYGCYFVEVWTPSQAFNKKPQAEPVPLIEARRLVAQISQRLAVEPQCPGEPGAAPKAPPAPPLGAPAAPAAKPTEATKPSAPAPQSGAAPAPAAPAASPAAAGPAPAAPEAAGRAAGAAVFRIETALEGPLTGQAAPKPLSPDEARRGWTVGAGALWLSVVLNVVNRVIGLGGPRPPAGTAGGTVGLPAAIPPRGGPGQPGGAR